MIKSKYNIVSQNIIFNTKTFAKLKLDEHHLEIFNNGFFDMFNDSEKKLLADNGFLVESNEKELQEITTKLNDKEKNEMRLIIFPTMQCNFRCTYCYEDKTNINLDDEKYSKLIEIIDKFNGKYIYISWFGGEPSLKSSKIISFLKLVKDKCIEKNISLQCGMTTNFYLIDLNMLNNYVNSGIKYFQVTLDGLKMTHDKYRPLVDGSGTFDRVYDNLRQALLSNLDFKIALRLNYDNKTDYKDFFEMMIPFSKDKRFTFEIHPICNWDEKNRDYACNDFETKERKKEIQALMNSLKIQIDNESIFSKYMPCYACLKNNYIVDACGNIKKCTIHLNDKKNCLGKLNEFDNINDDIWTRYKYEECPNCEIFPLCLGKMCKYDNLDTFKKCRDKRVMEIEEEIRY